MTFPIEIEVFGCGDPRGSVLLNWAMQAIEGRSYKLRPRVAWKFPLAHDRKIEVRPDYEKDPSWRGVTQSDWGPKGSYSVHYFYEGALYPGFALFNEGGLYLRRAYHDQDAATDALIADLRAFLTDPIGAARLARSNCCYCGKRLSTPESVAIGVGPDCAGRYWSSRREPKAADPWSERQGQEVQQ